MKTTDHDNRYSVPGLERGLAILGAFTREKPELGAPELTAKLGLPRSTVFRLLQTLENLGYVVRSKDGRSYRLGVSVLRMGFEYLASQDVVEVGRPLIDRLSLRAGLPAHLVIRDGRSVIYVVCVKPRAALAGTVSVGTRLPAHATVFGRILMGDLSLAELRTLFPERDLARSTEQTPETLDALYALIKADRARGFGISEGFYEAGISTIAAPVRDDRGRIAAAVGLTITGPNVDPVLINGGAVEMAIDTASTIAHDLGYNGAEYAQALANATALHAQESRVA